MNLPKRGCLGNTVVDKELEHLARFLKILIALYLILIYPFFSCVLARLNVSSDVVSQTADELVVQLLIAMQNKKSLAGCQRTLVCCFLVVFQVQTILVERAKKGRRGDKKGPIAQRKTSYDR